MENQMEIDMENSIYHIYYTCGLLDGHFVSLWAKGLKAQETVKPVSTPGLRV